MSSVQIRLLKLCASQNSTFTIIRLIEDASHQISSYEGRETTLTEDAPFFGRFHEQLSNCFSVNVFEAQMYFKIITKKQIIIQYKDSCLPCIFDRQIADFKVQ